MKKIFTILLGILLLILGNSFFSSYYNLRINEDNKDISRIEIIQKDTDTIIEPIYYTNSFDSEEEELPVIKTFNRDNTLNIKLINDDLEKLTVVEDYYNVFVDNSSTIEKETYILNKSNTGDFDLQVNRRGNVKEEKAVYYIYANESNTDVFAFQVEFILNDK